MKNMGMRHHANFPAALASLEEAQDPARKDSAHLRDLEKPGAPEARPLLADRLQAWPEPIRAGKGAPPCRGWPPSCAICWPGAGTRG